MLSLMVNAYNKCVMVKGRRDNSKFEKLVNETLKAKQIEHAKEQAREEAKKEAQQEAEAEKKAEADRQVTASKRWFG